MENTLKDIRDLGHVIDREKAEFDIFITLEPPTKDMKKEAIAKGYYRSPSGSKHLRIQIKTIEELFKDNRLDMPLRHIMFKKAEVVDSSKGNLEFEL